jgi:hypothetical protein
VKSASEEEGAEEVQAQQWTVESFAILFQDI